ncbi:Methionyl-tRNA formyltransferase [Neochlamydia sp. TUME1]|uniref:methionyl-tRNA formyltransferase n=1 Tax=Neochlamydia sp. TUME1 TaxID=1478174 RepID=UPI00057F5118|nr:methionyl-tRNA formyltransferase [Neochlamydia sp. TUME1]KIC76821.1 Methionyl-tRNA formyltransferase [Neochlamydia sp. TUME1]
MKIVYFGTPQFAADILQHLLNHKIRICAVVTKPDRPKGRSSDLVPTPVKRIAQLQNPPLPVHQPALVSAPEFAEILQAYQADLFVVVAYGEIIKQHVLDMPSKGCINVHASLLPKYRGAAPIQHSIINGENETGITIMYMVRKMDAGDIIKMVKVPIGPNTTYGKLERLLCEAGGKALVEVLDQFEQGSVEHVEQDHSQATFAPKIELEDCEINWSSSAKAIHNLVRGVYPHPGAWCYVNIGGQKKRLKINSTIPLAHQGGPAGTLLPTDNEELIVACGQGALRILELQLEGKKAMLAEELIRGFPKDKKMDFRI